MADVVVDVEVEPKVLVQVEDYMASVSEEEDATVP